MIRFAQIRRGWLIALLLLLINEFASAQSIRYSNFFDHDSSAGGFVDVDVLDGNRVVAVGSVLNLTDNVNFYNGYHLIADESGNLESSEGINFQGVNFNTSAVVKSSYSNAIYSAGYFCDFNVESSGYCDFYFARIDEGSSDTIFTQIIERPDTADVLLNMVETRPNKIMLIGWTYDDTTNADADLLFITVDTLGNELNRVVYGGGGTDYIHSGIVIDEIGEVLMTGYTKSFGGADNDSWVIKTDSIGNVLWQETYNHLSPSGGDGGSKIGKLQDGNYVVAGAYDNTSLTASWAYLMKINPNGDEIWTRRYENMVSQGFWACEVLGDGNILAAGQTSNTNDGSQAGWLVKADANGDTLWTRVYNASPYTDLLRNMMLMPNGDILMVGFGRGENSTTQDGWILRVDSMGCVVENCFMVGIEESEVQENVFNIYPNPATTELHFELRHMEKQDMQLLVHDMMGKEVWKSASINLSNSSGYVIDVSTWAHGIYHCSLYSNHRLLHTQKVVLVK